MVTVNGRPSQAAEGEWNKPVVPAPREGKRRQRAATPVTLPDGETRPAGRTLRVADSVAPVQSGA
ncbi:hypothetical protein EAH89_09770 [Roseomonas nepalensis]|uniref:Uncharacterized protein n=1 Tax=Muricoccus nepalensis TaxID=1854500 RepID=A0A502G7W3_9PROT|nr:hypothetical protein EAH89_09770 [Roseomonas nepalensis]